MKDRSLVVNATEAERVREIYRQYLKLGCVSKLKTYLADLIEIAKPCLFMVVLLNLSDRCVSDYVPPVFLRPQHLEVNGAYVVVSRLAGSPRDKRTMRKDRREAYDKLGKLIGTVPNDTTSMVFASDLERAFRKETFTDVSRAR